MSLTLLAVLVAYFVAWQGYKLRSRVSGLGHWALLVALVCYLLQNLVVRLHTGHFVFFDDLDRRTINGIRYSFTIPMVAAFYLFRLSLEGYTIRSRRAVRVMAIAALVLAALTLTFVFFIPPGNAFGVHHSLDALDSPGPAAYRIVLDTYTATADFLIGRFLWRYARTEDEPVRLGLRIVAFAGAVTVPASCIVRSAPLLIHHLGGPRIWVPNDIYYTAASVNGVLLFLGLSYPLLVSRAAAVRAWWRQRGTYSKLEIIWNTCTTVYPAIVFRSDTGTRPKVWTERLIRRRNECLDALTQLLGGEDHEQTEVAQQAADDLREAIRTYDADPGHPGSVADVVSSSTRDDSGARTRHVGRHDPSTAVLLALADILRKQRSEPRQQPTT
jgi:hypothetical protein